MKHLWGYAKLGLGFLIMVTPSASFGESWDEYLQHKKSEAAAEAVPVPVPVQKSVSVKKRSKKMAKNTAAVDRSPAGERLKSVPNSKPSAVRPSHTDSPVAESPAEPAEEETRITGDWAGARSKLSKSGVDIALIYKSEITRNFQGGRVQQTDYLGNIDLRTSLNFEKMMDWKGGSAFFYVLHDHGGHPQQHIGDLQGTQNLETKISATKLYEAWLQQTAFDDKVSLLVGLHDLNSEFYVTDAAGLFFNNSFGTGPDLSQTGVNGPSIFPSTSTAIRLRAEPSKSFYIQTAMFNAQAGDPNNLSGTYFRVNAKDGQLAISEAAVFNHKDDPKGLYGKYAFGVWNYSRTFDLLDGSGKGTSHGWYWLSEQFIESHIALFFRYGAASGDVNRIANCVSAGVTFNGLLGRPKDRFGLGYARVGQSDEYIQSIIAAGGNTLSSESAFEFTYRYELIPGIALQPDFQYVMHPGADPALNNVLAGSMRVELNF